MKILEKMTKYQVSGYLHAPARLFPHKCIYDFSGSFLTHLNTANKKVPDLSIKKVRLLMIHDGALLLESSPRVFLENVLS